MLGVGALAYMAFLDDVKPLESERLIAAEGLAIGANAHVITTRELCFSRSTEADAIRSFQRHDDDAETRTETGDEMYTPAPVLVHFDAGCAVRSRRIEIPAELRPGRYIMRTGLRSCNDIGRCQASWLSPIQITIIGDGDRRLIRAKPAE